MKEIHWGEVTRNNGPDLKQGQIIVKCESLLPDGRELPDPVFPSFDLAGVGWGIFFVPLEGATVELEVEAGKGSIDFSEVRYRSMTYSDIDDIASEFKTHYPLRWGIKTPLGHLLFFDNLDGSAVFSSPGEMKIEGILHTIELTETGITITHALGAKIELIGSNIIFNQGTAEVARKGDEVMTGVGPLPILEGAPTVFS